MPRILSIFLAQDFGPMLCVILLVCMAVQKSRVDHCSVCLTGMRVADTPSIASDKHGHTMPQHVDTIYDDRMTNEDPSTQRFLKSLWVLGYF